MNTVRDTLRKLAPVIGEARTNMLWRAYLTSDSIARRELEGMLDAYAAQALGDVPSGGNVGLFPPPPPERCLGEIELGHIRYAGKDSFSFGLRKDELLRHVGIYGSSGCGKSNAIALILDGLAEIGTPFLLCDFKRTFRSLLHEKRDILVLTAGDNNTAPFRFNPLIPPPGASTEVWAKKVIGALSHAYCQGAGSESLLVSALDEAYAAAARQGRWPSFQDVAEILDTQPARGRKGMWMDSARRAVGSISSGNAGQVFCPVSPMNIVSLLKRSVILEMDLLNQSEQTFLAEALILWIIQYRMNGENTRESLQHAIVIEEAHHLLRSPPGVGDGSEPVIHIALREVRELGESVILATQNASVVPVAVFGNQATTIAMHTKHAKDVSSTAQAMLLFDEAKDELGRLPVGDAIVRIPRWADPVHIRVKHRPIAKGTITDLDIQQQAANSLCSNDTANLITPRPEWALHSAVPVPEDKQVFPMESPSSQACSSENKHASPTTAPEKTTPESLDSLSALETEMLQDIIENPFDGVVKRIKRVGVSRRKGTAALLSLENRGLVRPSNIFTGSSIIKLFDMTNAGRTVYQSLGLGVPSTPTEGGVEHRYWIHHVANRLKSDGWQTQREYEVSTDVTVDIHAQNGERTVAVLVETGHSNVKGNIAKTIKAGYSEVWVVSNSPRVRACVVSFLKIAACQAQVICTEPGNILNGTMTTL